MQSISDFASTTNDSSFWKTRYLIFFPFPFFLLQWALYFYFVTVPQHLLGLSHEHNLFHLVSRQKERKEDQVAFKTTQLVLFTKPYETSSN